MIKAEQIPISDEAVEAVIVSLYQEKFWALSPEEQAIVRSDVRNAFAAGLAAWPRMEIHTDGAEDWIELTLTQEKP